MFYVFCFSNLFCLLYAPGGLAERSQLEIYAQDVASFQCFLKYFFEHRQGRWVVQKSAACKQLALDSEEASKNSRCRGSFLWLLQRAVFFFCVFAKRRKFLHLLGCLADVLT